MARNDRDEGETGRLVAVTLDEFFDRALKPRRRP